MVSIRLVAMHSPFIDKQIYFNEQGVLFDLRKNVCKQRQGMRRARERGGIEAKTPHPPRVDQASAVHT